MESVGTDSLVVSALTNSATVSGDPCLIIGLRAFANHIPLSPPHTIHYTVLCNRHKKATKIIYIKKFHLQIGEFFLVVGRYRR